MSIHLNIMETFALSMVVLFVGAFVSSKISALRKYNIPEPVVGGILFALINGGFHFSSDLEFSFDVGLKDPMMYAFFATIGLGANMKMLKDGSIKVFIFLGVASIFLIVQNFVGVGLAKAMGLDPLIGLLAGSITLSGGHGTGALYAAKFTDVVGANEIAMACATFGLILGGVVGGPLAQRLIAAHKLAPDEKVLDVNEALKGHGYDEPELVTPKTMLEMLFILALCLVLGKLLHSVMMDYWPSLQVPEFVPILLLGIIFTNFFELTGIYKMPQQTIDLIGVLSLSTFLTMALMDLHLWELINLAGPLLVLMVAQVLVTILFTALVTFKVMGKDYQAAVVVGGHNGFGLGSTATAVANMEAIVMRYGPAPEAFLIISLVGASLIDLMNILVIHIFVTFLS